VHLALWTVDGVPLAELTVTKTGTCGLQVFPTDTDHCAIHVMGSFMDVVRVRRQDPADPSFPGVRMLLLEDGMDVYAWVAGMASRMPLRVHAALCAGASPRFALSTLPRTTGSTRLTDLLASVLYGPGIMRPQLPPAPRSPVLLRV